MGSFFAIKPLPTVTVTNVIQLARARVLPLRRAGAGAAETASIAYASRANSSTSTADSGEVFSVSPGDASSFTYAAAQGLRSRAAMAAPCGYRSNEAVEVVWGACVRRGADH